MEPTRVNKNILPIAVLIVLFLVPFVVKGCRGKQKAEGIPPRPVETAVAVKKDVPMYVDSFGTLAALNSVNVKSQVTGKIEEVNFEEGQKVKAGDLLFTIDPAEYKAELDKAAASLAADTADLKLKRDTYKRNSKLVKKNLISLQDFEKCKTELEAAKAQVKLDEANMELAKINMEYCYIRSPIEGVTGKRKVDKGNIVSANTGSTLVTVKTVDELDIDFTLPERELPRVREAMTGGRLKVRVAVDGDGEKHHFGELKLVDNKVDDKTGTFSLRGVVNNADETLWPGQFVRVRLMLGTEKGAVIVPYETVQLGKKGYYAFAITEENKADLREVEPGPRSDGDIVIKKGVSEGETIVTTGQMGLAPGVTVVDVTQKMKSGGKTGKEGNEAAKK